MLVRDGYYDDFDEQTHGIYRRGVHYLEEKSFDQAKACFETLVERRHVSAIFNLAGLEGGGGSSIVRIRQARRFYRLAARLGHDVATRWVELFDLTKQGLYLMSYVVNVLLPKMQVEQKELMHPALMILLLLALERLLENSSYPMYQKLEMVSFIHDVGDVRALAYLRESGLADYLLPEFDCEYMGETGQAMRLIRQGLQFFYEEQKVNWVLCILTATILGKGLLPSFVEYQAKIG